MAREKKTYADDDGRTIADMSGVTRRNLWGLRLPGGKPKGDPAPEQPADQEKEDRPWDTSGQFNREERRAYILGTLGAALLVALPYAIVFAIAIWIIGGGLSSLF